MVLDRQQRSSVLSGACSDPLRVFQGRTRDRCREGSFLLPALGPSRYAGRLPLSGPCGGYLCPLPVCFTNLSSFFDNLAHDLVAGKHTNGPPPILAVAHVIDRTAQLLNLS